MPRMSSLFYFFCEKSGLSGHESELAKFAGTTVTIVGELDSDDVILVSSVFRPRGL